MARRTARSCQMVRMIYSSPGHDVSASASGELAK
jgi:hypothetical protein